VYLPEQKIISPENGKNFGGGFFHSTKIMAELRNCNHFKQQLPHDAILEASGLDLNVRQKHPCLSPFESIHL